MPAIRQCRHCSKPFQVLTRADANRQYCSRVCSRKAIEKNTLAFYEANPGAMRRYNKARVANR